VGRADSPRLQRHDVAGDARSGLVAPAGLGVDARAHGDHVARRSRQRRRAGGARRSGRQHLGGNAGRAPAPVAAPRDAAP
jgi:hypothetical protein